MSYIWVSIYYYIIVLFDCCLLDRTMKTNESLYSKWFLEALGHDGLNKLLAGYEDKSAQAVCTFAFSSGPGAEPILFQGRTEVCLYTPRKINKKKKRRE